MLRCIELAQKAFGKTYPNPMVGCVIVHNGVVIGEGFHHKAGEPHAEVNAIASVQNQNLLHDSTLYVNLEPCSHFGKTPPCADLIVSKMVKRVVVGCVDTFSKVSGHGIEKLKNAGVDVTVNVLQENARFLNRRFFTYHEKKRPYVILKWAQTADHFIDKCTSEKSSSKGVRITDDDCLKLSHRWRSEEQAILVGTNTAVCDNPSLTTRYVEGRNPLRVAWDLHDRIPASNCIFDDSTPTIIFTSNIRPDLSQTTFISVCNEENLVKETLSCLYERNIQSVIVEGGTQTLQSFINANLWDEARIFTTKETFGNGVASPQFDAKISSEQAVGNAMLTIHYNR